jgi:hypothetical protein
MATNNLYDVVYEYGNKVMKRDLVLAASGDENAIKAVLSTNQATNTNGRESVSGGIKIIAIRNASIPNGVLS